MRDTHNTTQRAGFTLIEMLLVVTIIGILAAMAVLKIGGQGEVARRETTRGTIATISQAIQMYGLSHSGLPDSLDELTIAPNEDVEAPLDKNSLSDSWGQPIQYKKLSKVKFELRSGGTDKQIGTEDDLTNPD
jgi:general secretion pathway protein G